MLAGTQAAACGTLRHMPAQLRLLLALGLVTFTACRSAPEVQSAPAVQPAPRVAHEAPAARDDGLVVGEFPLAEKKPVLDGDTIKVSGLDGSLRLLGVDTEETFKKKKEKEAFAKGWASYLAEMQGTSKRPVKMATPAGMAGWEFAKEFFKDTTTVRIERDHPGETRDFYGRHLAYVSALKDGRWTLYNVEVVRAGWSPYFTKYGRSRRFHEAFVAAQAEAKAAKRGIWGDDVLHYPDYAAREVWWDGRMKVVDAFEARETSLRMRDQPVPDMNLVPLTRDDALERLAALVGKKATVLGLVGEVVEPKAPKAPWIVKLAKDQKRSFELVFFDAAVLDASGVRGQAREYVEVSGKVTEYNGRPQIVVGSASQVRTFATPSGESADEED